MNSHPYLKFAAREASLNNGEFQYSRVHTKQVHSIQEFQKKFNYSSLPQYKQEGYILLMSLILLTLLTILAISGVVINTSQTQVATNVTETEVSFEKAEGAINQALNLLINGTYSAPNFVLNSSGLYLLNPSNTPLWNTVNWSSSTAVINSFQGYSGSQASFIIEQLPSVVKPGQSMKTPTHVYRITARAVGASGNSSIMLQSTLQIQQ